MITQVRLWLRSVLLRRRLEREMQEEIADHLERSTERLLTRGLTAEEARREALREFGNVGYLQEEGRIARGTQRLDSLVTDVKYALRHFGRQPLSTIAILAILALGIGINSALFTFFHSYAVQPPPGVPRAEDLVRIRGSLDGRITRGFALEELEGYRRLTSHFSAVAGWTNETVAVRHAAEETVAARAIFVTANYFPVLGVTPALGPGLPTSEAADPADQQVAVIGHEAWGRLFANDPAVVGRSISVNGMPFMIAGVAPPRFKGVAGENPLDVHVWLPLANHRLVVPAVPVDAETFGAVGRLRAGVTVDAVSAAVQVVAGRVDLARERRLGLERSTDVAPLLAENVGPDFDEDFAIVAGAFGALGLLILLVTCTNVSSLLTGLALARRREIAIRLSLGASRARVLRQLLTESVLLSTVAAAISLGIVWAIVRGFIRAFPDFPYTVVVNWPAALFTFGVALSVGALFGLSPALHATRVAIAGALKDTAGTVAAARARLHRMLVIAQIAFTQPLAVCLAASLLIVLGEYGREGANPASDRIIELHFESIAGRQTRAEPDSVAVARQRSDLEAVERALESTPGILAAGRGPTSNDIRPGYAVHPDDRIAGGAQQPVLLSVDRVEPGYFSLLGAPIVLGRGFAPEDLTSQQGDPVAATPVVIGGDLARRLWPGSSPIGRRLRQTQERLPGGAFGVLEVIGVVDESIAGRADFDGGFRVYIPTDRVPSYPARVITLLIRTTSAAEPLIPTIRETISRETGAPVYEIRTLAQIEADDRFALLLATTGIAGGAFLALLLSALGLYVVVAFMVSQRKGEIAVRMAIGALPRQVVRHFATDGVRLSFAGVLLGLPLGLLALRLGLGLSGAREPDFALVSATASLGILLVAAAATWIPARRAAQVDPAVTLRRD